MLPYVVVANMPKRQIVCADCRSPVLVLVPGSERYSAQDHGHCVAKFDVGFRISDARSELGQNGKYLTVNAAEPRARDFVTVLYFFEYYIHRLQFCADNAPFDLLSKLRRDHKWQDSLEH